MTASSSPFRRSKLPILLAGAILLLLATGLLSSFWLPDMLGTIRPHLAGLLLGIALVLLVQRRIFSAAISALAGGGILALTLPAGQPLVSAQGRTEYTALQLNLSKHNTNAAAVLDLIDAERPDFVAFKEYTERWHEMLSGPLAERYPYQLVEPRRDFQGLALLSRHPVKESDLTPVPGNRCPIVRAEVRLPDGEITLLVVHAESPRNRERFGGRNLMFERLASLAASAEKDGAIALGGLNAAPWSGNLAILRERAGLEHPRPGWWFRATWPAALGWFGVPVDQILLTDRLRATDYRIGPSVGSDHRPVICRFVFVGVES